MPLLVRTYIKKLVSDSISSDVDLNQVLGIIENEFDSIKYNKK